MVLAHVSCIHCGDPVLDRKGRRAIVAYDQYLLEKAGILKLLQCSTCDCIADKYVEYEGALILLDLFLFYPEAYRHVIFNGKYQTIIFKMVFMTLLVDGYLNWAVLDSSGEFFEREHQFYGTCFQALLSLATYIMVVLLSFSRVLKWCDLKHLFSGLLLAYSVRFGNMLALMWVNDIGKPGSGYMWTFVNLQFFGASIRMAQVITGRYLGSVLVLGIAFVSFFVILKLDSVAASCQ